MLVMLTAGPILSSGTALAASDITEYTVPTPGSAPYAIAVGPDGNLWFTEVLGNKVAKVTPLGAFTEYKIPSALSQSEGITAGPDGNLWFTEFGPGKVAKVTTSGVITEYPIPTVASGPSGIAQGPDGKLWLTESGANKVAKVTTSGAFTEYTVPTTNSGPTSIASGSDGNLWVTERYGNKVARVTTSGAVSEYLVPTPNSEPIGIVAGPDGNLWLTESAANQVAKVTPAGVFTEYVIPTAFSHPEAITAVPNGDLWFTENSGYKVAKVTTSGIFTEHTMPSATSLPGIVVGPDGFIWFTEEGGGKIGKIAANIATSPPIITSQPADQMVAPGTTATFTSAASGNPAPTVKWQSAFAGTPFADVVGATSTTLTITGVTAAMNGIQYRAVFSNSAGTTPSNAAMLTVATLPTVSVQPADQTVSAGRTATFTSLAYSNPIPTVQWQVSTNGGSTFADVAGATSTTLTVPSTTVAMSGNRYRAAFTNLAGTVASSAATLTVNPAGPGDIAEYPIPTANSNPAYIALGAGGDLWFTELRSNKIGRFTVQPVPGLFAEYSIPTVGAGPFGITAGPDGNVWFTEGSSSKIGRVTATGIFTEFVIPTPGSNPFGITTGPDGNLWFTELGGNNIGRLTPSGTFTEFGLPLQSNGLGSWPEGITTGPDGNLWFTESASNKIGRITLAGALTHYPVPSGGAGQGIASGPDGNLWFTQGNAQSGGAIDRVTPAGVFTQYLTADVGSLPIAITSGPDGNLWVTESKANKVARVTPNGLFTEYPVPTPGGGLFGFGPYGITTGPDGNLWFTEYDQNKLAMVKVGAAVPSAPTVTTQPLDQTVTAGATATFTAVASGAPTPTVQWQVSTNGGVTFTDLAGATSSTLSVVNTTAAMSGNRYHAVFTNSAGTATSTAATLTVNAATGNSPQGLLAEPDNSAVTLRWQPPADTGGGPVTGYAVRVFNNGVVAGSPTMFASATTTEVIANLLNGSSYTFQVAAQNVAGPGPFSSLSSAVVPSAVYPWVAVSDRQYSLANSDGVTWTDMDNTYLSMTVTPQVDSRAMLSANADLWTANAGYNQDIGIAVSGGIYPTAPGQPEAWKESGGFAGTFSPNAAAVQSVIDLKAGIPYIVTLVWKTNRVASGTYIFAGAGPIGPDFSPTRLMVQLVPAANVFTNGSSSQFLLTGSNGATWTDLGPATDPSLTVIAPSNGSLLVSANADLWTATAGFNQDIGITVSGGTGVGTTYPTVASQPEAWKESGGFAGTLSPNAAFVQAVLPVASGQSYTLKLQWKTNKPGPSTIVAGAGPIGDQFSPTRLTAWFVASTGNTSVQDMSMKTQPSLSANNGMAWADVDGAHLSVSITKTTNCLMLVSGNADLWTAGAGYNQDIGVQVSSNAATVSSDRVGWKESGGFAGTYSPNAAFVQTMFPIAANAPYTVTLQWKANKDVPAGIVFAGAGPIGTLFSPTRLTVVVFC
jgi:streptogramin lyase